MIRSLALPAVALATAAAPPAQLLYAVDAGRVLLRIDLATGQGIPIATVSSNAGTPGGLAYDPATRTVYLSSVGNAALYRLDLHTGFATFVGPYGSSALVMHGLEWDASTGTLYGVSAHDNGLYRIDPTTGAAARIGASSLQGSTNLGHDTLRDVLLAANGLAGQLYRIDRATGAATPIGPLAGPSDPGALAFAADRGTLFLADRGTDALYSVDPTTGAATLVGPIGPGDVVGLAYIPRAGSILRIAHGCGRTPITISGEPQIGGVLATSIGSVGIGAIGLGFAPASVPFCGCTIGHDWAVALFTPALLLGIPHVPALVNTLLVVQGIDLFGVGGCSAPQLTLTDTLVITIG